MKASTHVGAGAAPLRNPPIRDQVSGEFVTIEGRRFYRIRNVDGMAPFFMTVVSPSDHWMFIGSNGTLSAGRQNNQSSLFPYYTSDKILDSGATTGPVTMLVVERGDQRRLWQPFTDRYAGIYDIERSVAKSVLGDTILFEETNRDLGLSFSYSWSFSDRFGFVRRSVLRNTDRTPCKVAVLDGVQNLLPHGVAPDAQNGYSGLLDAYKRSEFRADAGLAVFALSSRLTDKAEPSEALRATVAWQDGLDGARVLLSSRQIASFCSRTQLDAENEVCGERCAYLLNASVDLAADAAREWRMVFELNLDHAAVADLASRLVEAKTALLADLDEDVRATTKGLEAILGTVDGFQAAGDETITAHHTANVLFNTMRGGVYADGYRLDRADVASYVKKANRSVYDAHRALIDQLPDTFTLGVLKQAADRSGSPDLQRLCRQYLPLTFSRRHGDPSRPWNWFSINVRNPDGSKRLDYQGNWRDIFQNWEALNMSFPDYLESSICTFLNFTTADGYNPYRVSRDGIDWEEPEPHNPWANIGYWGDHQVIYLLKLLEACEDFHPEALQRLLDQSVFSHAHVPYKIRSYELIRTDPFSTIDFDHDLDHEIEKRVKKLGFDGRMLMRGDGVVHATMLEKLLILLLTKLSNYAPGAGIWMNTQRPEWNDANNALVGRGTSVVTLGYLRRYTAFLSALLRSSGKESFALEETLATFLGDIDAAIRNERPQTASRDERACRRVTDDLGRAGSDYRHAFYERGLSDAKRTVRRDRIGEFLELVLAWIDEGLRVNRRQDGLYHAYNTISLDDGLVRIRRLKEMLEGQVSILSSGALSPAEAADLLDALRRSALYREDQNSYLLYPNILPPGFLHKNTIPQDRVASSPLLLQLIEAGDRSLVTRDRSGAVHFNGDLRNRNDVATVLAKLHKTGYADALAQQKHVVDLFEEHFDHTSYTGRSGTFFAYEGLGSIYWHMVSKLLLAVQENYVEARDGRVDPAICRRLHDHYDAVRGGLGFNKSPAVYGAFPTDPYSHTPWGKGAQQPGMTGQVKEEVLTRLGELGVRISGGVICFEPALLATTEWLKETSALSYLDVSGATRTITLDAGSLGFTFCQVPIVYIRSSRRQIDVRFRDGSSSSFTGTDCGVDASRHIVSRDGHVESIHVFTDIAHE